jgi:hypothetical protein
MCRYKRLIINLSLRKLNEGEQGLSVLKEYYLGMLKFKDSEMFFAMLSLLSPVIIAIP